MAKQQRKTRRRGQLRVRPRTAAYRRELGPQATATQTAIDETVSAAALIREAIVEKIDRLLAEDRQPAAT